LLDEFRNSFAPYVYDFFIRFPYIINTGRTHKLQKNKAMIQNIMLQINPQKSLFPLYVWHQCARLKLDFV
jgi:hypothetical protein